MKQKNTLNQRMQYTYPVLSRIGPWSREKQRVAEVSAMKKYYFSNQNYKHLQERFIQECQWSAHEEALTLCKEFKLHQAVYFLQRDLTFMREVSI